MSDNREVALNEVLRKFETEVNPKESRGAQPYRKQAMEMIPVTPEEIRDARHTQYELYDEMISYLLSDRDECKI